VSSIGSVSSQNSNRSQYMALLASQSASRSSGVKQSDGDSDDSGSPAASGATAATGSTATSASSSTSLQDQLVAAITNAVQTAEQSGNTSSLNSTIQDAVNQVFKDNGINPDTLKQQATGQTQGAAHHHHHHHSEPGSASQSSGASSQPTSGTSTQSGATTQTSGTPSTTVTQQTSGQQIADLLAQISGTSGGSQSVSGFLLNVQT